MISLLPMDDLRNATEVAIDYLKDLNKQQGKERRVLGKFIE